jgi:hypothetical protein
MDAVVRIMIFITGALSMWGEYACVNHYPAHGILWLAYGVWFLVGFLMVNLSTGIDWSDFFLFEALGDLLVAIFSAID